MINSSRGKNEAPRSNLQGILTKANKIVKAFTVIIIIFMALLIFDRNNIMPMDFTRFQWKNRLLFLFAPDSNDRSFQRLQSEIMAQKAEVEDRDLVVFEVLERGPSRMNTIHLEQETVDSIRKRFAMRRSTFRVILIGKDGGMKLKRDSQASLEEIFDLIDSMPMRKNEMRQKNQQY
jgi:hypothetical protein